MRSFKYLSLVAAALMASTAIVNAADLIPPPQEDYPPEVISHGSAGGWYLRGDIGYASMDVQGVTYFQGPLNVGKFEQHDLDSTWYLQGGVGYQVTDYFRVDATLAYFGSADFDGSSAPAGSGCAGAFPASTCSYNDDMELESITMLMANAYVDLGTFSGITPYVGAGIGGAHVTWGTLLNDQTCTPADPVCDGTDFTHPGGNQWRFAWALHAGASYDINCRMKIDGGYTFTHIEGGDMFGSGTPVGGGAIVGGNGYDDGIKVHAGHIGLRYHLDDSACTPPPPPIVYK